VRVGVASVARRYVGEPLLRTRYIRTRTTAQCGTWVGDERDECHVMPVALSVREHSQAEA